MNGWKGKTAVVTGANNDFGVAIIKMLLKDEIIAVGMDNDSTQLLDLQVNNNFHFMKIDLLNEEEILEGFQTVEEKFGGADILVNNAELSAPSSILDGKKSDWKNMVYMNIVCLSLCSREFLRSIRDRKVELGHIINISNYLSQIMPKKSTDHFYAATKQSVFDLNMYLRHEMENSDSFVKVSSITPRLRKMEENNRATDLPAENIAASLKYMLSTPYHVQVRDVAIEQVQ